MFWLVEWFLELVLFENDFDFWFDFGRDFGLDFELDLFLPVFSSFELVFLEILAKFADLGLVVFGFNVADFGLEELSRFVTFRYKPSVDRFTLCLFRNSFSAFLIAG
jgi:hypothetical protein